MTDYKTQDEQIAELTAKLEQTTAELDARKQAERDEAFKQVADKHGLDWLPHVKHLLSADSDAQTIAAIAETMGAKPEDDYEAQQLREKGIGIEPDGNEQALRAALVQAERKAKKTGSMFDRMEVANLKRQLAAFE
ncbi:hypothetical protein [Sporosarcina obsidiansis]|uniref:hypothetical protein n=1 Tax=Sporosarcina obsidiansis TaxID=2660748 RepID=UPI00129BE902|nr:hypothetical protein [Sporosarcina obsidiansis]